VFPPEEEDGELPDEEEAGVVAGVVAVPEEEVLPDEAGVVAGVVGLVLPPEEEEVEVLPLEEDEEDPLDEEEGLVDPHKVELATAPAL
jgi:hypothetical protein